MVTHCRVLRQSLRRRVASRSRSRCRRLGSPLTPNRTTGANGSFADECDAGGILTEYACDAPFVSVASPSQPPLQATRSLALARATLLALLGSAFVGAAARLLIVLDFNAFSLFATTGFGSDLTARLGAAGSRRSEVALAS